MTFDGRPSINLPPSGGIIVDLFAGGGGASTAIFMATGRHPDVAVNHNPVALDVHAANHPTTRHFRCDVFEVDPLEATGGRAVDLLWASPDCTHFSKARGGKPVEKRIRSLADVVVVWARFTRPRVIALENVEEFKDWGPVLENGKPCPEKKGLDFLRWKRELEDLGYVVESRELVAADYGAPTTRKRLFLIARCDGQPIRWPAPTHASRAKIAAGAPAAAGLKPWRAAAEIIDWTIPVPTIFDRPRPLKPKTLARIAKGLKRFVIDAPTPFIVPVTHTSGGNQASDTVPTITTARGGELAVSVPTILPLTHGGGQDRVYDSADPLRTVTGAHRGEMALMSGVLKPRYGEREGQEPRSRDVQEPYPTVVGDGNGGDLSAVLMQKMSENGKGYRPDEPLHTVMAGAPRHAETVAFLGRQFGSTVSGRDAAEPHPAVMGDGGGGKSQVVAAHLTRQFGASVGSDAAEPVGTVMPRGSGKTALAAASMVQHNGDQVGRPAIEPVTTLTDRSTQQQLMAATIDKFYATGVAHSAGEPLGTATARDRFAVNAAFLEQANTGVVGHEARAPVSTIVGNGCTQRLIDVGMIREDDGPSAARRAKVLTFLWDHFGAPTEADWADPASTAQSRLRFGLVLIEGCVWQIVDIGMRMLVPRELFNAQGFPPTYVIDVVLDAQGQSKAVTKTAQTSLAGNSVSPPPAAAMLRVNLPEHMLLAEAA